MKVIFMNTKLKINKSYARQADTTSHINRGNLNYKYEYELDILMPW